MTSKEVKKQLNEINRLIELEQKRVAFGSASDTLVLDTLKTNRTALTVLFIRLLIKEKNENVQ